MIRYRSRGEKRATAIDQDAADIGMKILA